MEIGELIFVGFCSLAALNAIFFTGYIWFRRDRNIYPGILLSLFMIITAYRITQMLLHDLQDDFNLGVNLKTIFFFIPTFPLIGPLLYLYIKSVSVKDFHFRLSHLLHLIPFIIFLVLDLLNRENFPLSPDNRSHYITYCIQISAILIQFLTYIIISLFFTKRLIKKSITGNFSKENVNPYWLRNIVIIISFLWLIFALYCVQTYIRVYLAGRVIEALYYSVLSYWIFYNELRSQKITSLNNFNIKYKSSGLTKEDSARYKDKILDYVIKNEVYKNHDITLGKLAKDLSLTTHVVSQIINEQFAFNFNDFINSYRIEEAKKMLTNPGMKNITVASIAYDSGFNTLSAFNTAFKKFTGLTPSRFREKNS